MKFINVEQGSPAWLSWRKTVITATEASIIMGNNPWETPYSLWQRKLGLIPEKESNEAMERGKRLEPEARALFVQEHGIDMLPKVVESIEFDFLGASLDGMSTDTKRILEIKCGGIKLHDMACNGQIPAYYMDQMQHQMLVTGADKCYYYSYDGTKGICIEVEPDMSWREAFMPKAREFWKCIALGEPPALQDRDYKDMTDVPAWSSYAEQYRQISQQIKNLEEEKDSYRKELLKLSGDRNCIGCGIKVIKTVMRGRVNYDQIPEIKQVDLDQYRKSPITSWKILVA